MAIYPKLNNKQPAWNITDHCEDTSNLCHTAIDKQFDAVDKAAIVTSEKNQGFGNLIGCAYSSQWDIVGLGYKWLRLFLAQSLDIEPKSWHNPRTNGVNPDLALFEVECPIAGKRAHSGFGCAVNAEGWGTHSSK